MRSGCFIKSFAKSGAGVAALLLASAALVPGAAQAQHFPYECEVEITDPSHPDFGHIIHLTECGEVTSGVVATGQRLGALGDSYTQQQLNFGAVGGFATPTGRLRTTKHDGLRDKTTGLRTDSFETDEASVFANVSYDLPGTYFGGRVRVTGLVGYDWMSQDSDVPGGFSTDIDSIIYGGSYLWSSGSFYTMTLIIGLSGEADSRNVGGSYSYDVTGYFTNSVVGNTFDLPGTLKFDLRGSIGHYDVEGDRFVVPGTQLSLKGTSESWNGAVTGTLFTIIEVDGGGVMRPYILGAYKHVFDEDIDVRGDVQQVSFDQDDDYGRGEVGFDYVEGALTYGAAAYTEISSDQETFGGRLGISVKLQ